MPDTHPAAIETAIADAIERIGDRFSGHPAMLRGMLAKPVHDAYQHGRHDALSELLTTDQVALTLGLTRQHVHRLARTHDVGWHIGRDYLFRPEDVETLRTRPDGRRRG